jgi:hypothetical protein
MRQRKRHFNVVAAKVAVACLGMFLSSCHATPKYDSAPAATPAGNTCTKPTVVPMDSENAQSGVTKGSYYVTNDSWNASHYTDLSQILYVCNYNNWYTIATMNNDTLDGAVKTSPNVQETWYPTPTRLSRWKSITSRFSDVPPGTGSGYGIWEFEYDVWLNGLADSKSTEIMIWTYNNGQAPGGSPSGSFTDAGRTYDVYHSSPPYQYVAFVDRHGRLSGNLSLLDFFKYVISRGWMPTSSTLYQICNGVELVSTRNKPEKFDFNNFDINMRPDS